MFILYYSVLYHTIPHYNLTNYDIPYHIVITWSFGSRILFGCLDPSRNLHGSDFTRLVQSRRTDAGPP